MKKIITSLSISIMIFALNGCGNSGFKCDSTESKNLLEQYIKEQANVVFKAPEKLKEILLAFNNIQLMETSRDERKLTCAATAQAGSRTLDLQYYLELIKNADGTEMIALRRVQPQ